MYERLIYTNQRGETVEFSPYSQFWTNVPTDVVGLADYEADQHTVQMIGQDGDTWISGRIRAKRITVAGYIKPISRAAASSARQQLSHALDPHITGTLTYVRDTFRRQIEVHPSELPYTHPRFLERFSVTFECPDPFWRDAEEVTGDVMSWIKLWYWLRENGEPATYIEEGNFFFGERQSGGYADIVNVGDVVAGAVFGFTASATVLTPKITNIDTGEYIQINLDMEAGDVFEVDTRRGKKTVVRIRDGAETDIYPFLDSGSTFMQLAVGTNRLALSARTGEMQANAYVRYQPGYLGV